MWAALKLADSWIVIEVLFNLEIIENLKKNELNCLYIITVGFVF